MSYDLLKVGAAIVMSSPFVPLLFQGEEWGATSPFCYFTDHASDALGAAVRGGRAREIAAFGWDQEDIPDPQDPMTYEMSKLDWGEIEEPLHAEMLAWHRDLIALRARLPSLSDGRRDLVRTRYEPGKGWLVIERGPVTIAANFSDKLALAPLPARAGDVLLTSAEAPDRGGDVV